MRRGRERVRGTKQDERERYKYEDNKDAMPGTLHPGLTRRYERARESEVVNGHQKRGKRALLEDAHRYDSDSLGLSTVWRARESLEGEEMNVIGKRECRRVRERRKEDEGREKESKD